MQGVVFQDGRPVLRSESTGFPDAPVRTLRDFSCSGNPVLSSPTALTQLGQKHTRACGEVMVEGEHHAFDSDNHGE